MSKSNSETHYVIVVHGTWNPPKPGRKHWYQLHGDEPTNFCRRLNRRFAGGPLKGAVWRPCVSGDGDAVLVDFHWSGGNDHAERLKGATKLCHLIGTIREADPTCRLHFVAHSHGGNVLLSALWSHQQDLRANFERP